MATSIGEAVLTIGLDTAKLERDMKGVGGLIKKHSRAIGIGMTAVGATIVGGLGLSVKAAVDFEGAMREVNTMLGLNQTEFESLSKDVQDLSSDLGVDAVGQAKALYQAISAGVPKENVIDFLRIATKAAIGGVTDTEVAVDGLTTVINAYKLPMSEAQKISDALFATVKGGKTNFEELSANMSKAMPIAASLGVGYEEVLATVATLTKQGVPTAQAFTQIRASMTALLKPTAGMEKLISAAGFETGEAMLESLGYAETLNALTKAADGNNKILGEAFGSTEALGVVLGTTGDNAAGAAEDLDAVTNSAGAATAAFEEEEKSATRQMAAMKAMFKDIIITVGNVLLPILKDLIANIKPIIKNIQNWVAENPGLTKTIIKIVAIVGGLLLVLGPLLIMLPGIIAALPILGAAFAVLTGPVGLVILAIVAWGLAIKSLHDNWGVIMRGLKRVTETVINGIIGQINGLIKAINLIPGINIGQIGTVGTQTQALSQRTKDIMGQQKLKGMAGGGLITEPTLLSSIRTGRPYGIAGESGVERITPGGGQTITNNFQIAQLVVREYADVPRIAEELYVMQRQRSRGAGG